MLDRRPEHRSAGQVQPVATIAIPCHNGAAHLEPMVRSWLQQSRQDFELLLVDDASTDASVELVCRTAGDRVRIVRNQERRGLAANFAHAASLVKTPFFCLAHQDDLYERDYLQRLLAALEAEPDAAVAHCSATASDGDGNEITAAAERFKNGLARQAVGATRSELYGLLWRGNFVCCPSVLFRTAAYRAVGGFDTRLSFALDWELWFRMVRTGHRFTTVTTPLVRYRRHADNATRSATRSLRRFEEELQVLQEAHAHGVAERLMRAQRAPGRSLRNNLVNEAFEDLRHGDHTAFRDKLRFVSERVPHLRRDPYVLALRVLSRFGTLGVSALGLGRRAAVRLGLG